MIRKGTIACLLLCCAALLYGCGKKETGEIVVIEGQTSDEPEKNNTEDEIFAVEDPETKPGTILGEETVVLMRGETFEEVLYTRVQVVEEASVAYDPELFSMEIDGDGISFLDLRSSRSRVSIWEEQGDSTEALADSFVYKSNEECTVEDVTIGEGEYPATWVSYSEGTGEDEKTCDLYILRYNERLYVVRLDCTVGLYEEVGEEQQMILSTLRFDEG